MAVNLTIEGIDGQEVFEGFTLVGTVKIENDTTSSINVTGIQLISSVTNPSSDVSASPEQIVLGTIDPTIYGNAYTGSVAGAIEAGATGSFDITILANTNILSINNESYTLSAIAILNGDPNQLVYADPQAGFQVKPASIVAARVESPILTWSLWDNGSPLSPISNKDFDFQLATSIQLENNVPNQFGGLYNVLPAFSSLNNYSSSNEAVLTVVATASQTTALVGVTDNMTQLGAIAGSVRIVGVGTATVSNALQDGLTGSVVINVVDALPVKIEITPNIVNLAPAGTQQLTALLIKSNGQSTDISSTGVWSTGNSAVATVSSAGLITANSAVQQGTTAITVAYGNIVASVPVIVSARTYGLPTA